MSEKYNLTPEEQRWLQAIVESYDYNGEYWLRPIDSERAAIKRLVELGLISFLPPMVSVRVTNLGRHLANRADRQRSESRDAGEGSE